MSNTLKRTELLQEELTVDRPDHWISQYVDGHIGIGSLKGDAYKAVWVERLMAPARSKGEAVVRIKRSFDALKQFKALYAEEAATIKRGRRGRDWDGGQPAYHKLIMAAASGDANCFCHNQNQMSISGWAWLRQIKSLTGQELWQEAAWLAHYQQLPCNKGIAEWLNHRKVWDLLKVARVFKAPIQRALAVRIPMNILLRLVDMPAYVRELALKLVASHDGTVNRFEGGKRKFDREAFWSLLSNELKSGKTRMLKQLRLGQQVAHLVPMGVDKSAVYSTLRGRNIEPAMAWELIRSVKWSAYTKTYPVISQGCNSLAGDLTLRLVLTFGAESSRWLGTCYFHDRTEWLPLVPSTQLKGLAGVLFKHASDYQDMPYNRQKMVRIVAAAWPKMSEQDRCLPSLEQLYVAASTTHFVGITDANRPFALECAKFGIDQKTFEVWAARWVASLNVPNAFPVDRTWTSGGWVGRFLPRSDARGLFLGMYTNCCQHPSGAGSSCAWHGQTSPNGGYFVWENDKGIQAQSWVWISAEGGICFDNIEALEKTNRSEEYTARILAILNRVAEDLDCPVTLGTGYDTGFARFPQGFVQTPVDYSGYRDSNNQVFVRDGNTRYKTPVNGNVRMASEADLDAIENIARTVYPLGWQFASYEEGNAVMVVERSNHIVGYGILDTVNREITDIAVLPEHRGRPVVELVNRMVWFMQQVGDTWTAEARESTSLKLLRGMAKRGQIKLYEMGVQGYIGNEPLHGVTISFN